MPFSADQEHNRNAEVHLRAPLYRASYILLLDGHRDFDHGPCCPILPLVLLGYGSLVRTDPHGEARLLCVPYTGLTDEAWSVCTCVGVDCSADAGMRVCVCVCVSLHVYVRVCWCPRL